MIKQAEKDYSAAELEKRMREFWKKTKSYDKTVQLHSSGQDLYFVDGPPYTTGSIHLGTALNKIVKDTVVRWRRMKGYNVRDQPGFDMHGLPIEVQVEKSLGITNKKEIEAFGIEKFVNTCRDFSSSFLDKMTEQFSSLGVWFDWEHPYVTIANSYIEATWWTLKKAYEKGLLMEALRALPWCSRCETALAEAEIEYWDETDPSIYVLFPLVSRPGENILIWTTTPWTIPSNLAVAVHPNFNYVKVRFKHKGKEIQAWMIENNVEKILGEADVAEGDIEEKVLGKGMVGWEYSHPLEDKLSFQKEAHGEWIHRILESETVTEENTGVVHIAPGHGPEDYEIGKMHNMPIFSPVNESGKFTMGAGAYVGQHVREANALILQDLESSGTLLTSSKVTHRYGHCWRCRTPIIYRATTQWFLKVTEVKQKMLGEIDRVKWTPDWAGSSRQRDWTNNLKDWCITRQRYWGTPVPVWRCVSCKELRVIGSEADLSMGNNYEPNMDFHRPWIDNVTFSCQKCGGTQERVRDVLDVWLDSAVCSWAQLNFPKEEGNLKRWWPMDWISEAHDQTRGWFNSQLAASVIAFDRTPYKSVLMHGWMLGSDGQPMSKSLGNYVEPSEVIEKYGVDSLRLYLLKTRPPWEDISFNWEEVKNSHRTLNILWNVYKFAALYMSMDKFDPRIHGLSSLIKHLKPEDKWLLSRVERLKKTVDTEMEEYNLHKACRALEEFILNDLSRWYIRLVRDRTWIEGSDKSKLGAYKTLHEAMVTLCRLLAPFCPHISEAMYQNLDGRFLTVHMCTWPTVNEDYLNGDLEIAMATVQDLVEIVSQARQAVGMKLRWPLERVALKEPTDNARHAIAILKDVLMQQSNARNVQILEKDQEFEGLILKLRPYPEEISKVYKAVWSKIVTMLATREAMEVKKALEGGEYKLGIEGQIVRIQPEMVIFEYEVPERVKLVETSYGMMYIDMRITPEVKAEAFAREVIRRVQQMRKDMDLPVEDFVRTSIKVRQELAELMESWKDHIASETRSRVLNFGEGEVSEEYGVEWNVDGETFLIGITPLHMGEAMVQFTRIIGIDQNKAMILFDAGYKTLNVLNQASISELINIEGIDEVDAKHIKEHISKEARPDELACPICEATVTALKGTCWRCGESIGETEVPREKFIACPNCKSPVTEDAKICPICRLTLKEVKEPTIPAVEPEKLEKPEEKAPEELVPVPEEPAPVPDISLPIPEELPTMPEEPKPEPKLEIPELKESSTYLVKEVKPEEAYLLFNEVLTSGRKGFCVTRIFPQKIREKHKLENVPIIWLSNIGKEDSVRPKDLEKLSLLLEQFLSKEKGLVLLDGVEYLITNNNFLTVLRLVQSLRDQVAVNKATLLISVNPSTLDSHQLNLLEREVDGVIDLP